MATYDLHRSDLFNSHMTNLDTSVKDAVIQQLINDGIYQDPGGPALYGTTINDTPVAWQQDVGYVPPLDAQTQVLILSGASNIVNTDANLAAIIENTAANVDLTVVGSKSVIIGTGTVVFYLRCRKCYFTA